MCQHQRLFEHFSNVVMVRMKLLIKNYIIKKNVFAGDLLQTYLIEL